MHPPIAHRTLAGDAGASDVARVVAPPRAIVEFVDAVRSACDDGSFVSLVLSKPRGPAEHARVVRIRRISLKGRPMLCFVASYATRDVTKNLEPADALASIAGALDPRQAASYAHALLRTADGELQLLVSRKGRATLRRAARSDDNAHGQHADAARDGEQALASQRDAPASSPPPALPSHDRERRRRLPVDLPWLAELGLTDGAHRVVPSMSRKWRQIDKFLEVLDGALDALPASAGTAARPLRVVDYGSGKGYLTFAVHEHLRRRFGTAPRVTGVELRAELVDFCNDVARRSGCERLSFVQGDLASVAPEAMDIMIALHACDTATDHAIDLGVRAGAAILVCAPCCHRELRPQMARPRFLSGLLRHGVHLGQEAEMVTDSMRALLLETRGYDASVFEFVALEHTQKNKMILAQRRGEDRTAAPRARAELEQLKRFYGIREQRLDTLLATPVTGDDSEGDTAAQACQTP